MSIFSKKFGQRSEPEDLDSGYENPYYTVREPRRDTRNAESERYEERSEDYARRGTPAEEENFYDTRRAPERVSRDDVYEEEEPRSYRERMYEDSDLRRKPEKVVSKPENKGTLYYTPESYRDVRTEMVTALAESHVVVINLRNLVDTPEVVRLVDYVMGAVQVLGASLRRMGGNNLILIPKDVEIDEDDILLPEESYDEDEDYEEEYDEVYDEEYEEAYDDEAYDE